MQITITTENRSFTVDTVEPIDISIPLEFGGDQPNAFYLPRAEAVVAEGGEFIGDTRRGGSCNCETVTLNPHGNGTHTECIGHLSTNRIHINTALRDAFIPASLVSVPLRDSEAGPFIAADDLQEQLGDSASDIEALIIRTLPNTPTKREAVWSGENPPFLSPEATRLIRERGIRHLLVDTPSLDSESDPHLTSHRIFWELPPTGAIEGDPADGRTVTEMIFVPDHVSDGTYLLTIQVPPFSLDAAPSRPLLFGPVL